METTITASPTEKLQKPVKQKKSWLKKLNPLFWVTVAIPTVLSAFYFGSVASDIYIRNQASL
ncbi:capsule polysaccharide export transport system permease [Actinobacillus pleuropneumoniae]|nr:capsule polysaccharide export transport system permease [Actinobacillus pleuropneumoniae]